MRSVNVFVVIATIFLLMPASRAEHGPAGTPLWGYQNAGLEPEDAQVFLYDIGRDLFQSSCLPDPTDNGRGIAFDSFDQTLWYTFVDTVAPLEGDGLIHHMTRDCEDLGSIEFGDGPGGDDQDDIGALDTDPNDSQLWAAGYNPISVDGTDMAFFYKVDRSDGTIIARCSVPFADDAVCDGFGNDTLAVANLDLGGGLRRYLLSDVGERCTKLLLIDADLCEKGNPTVLSVELPVGVTGIDFEGGKLIVTDQDDIYDLGEPPFDEILATMSVEPGRDMEDITLIAPPIRIPRHPVDVPPDICPGGGGFPRICP